ncbi:MAG: methionine--tRNA ligase [Parcubacteria group bacterium]|nr:methionine--tRNA ligase [Parcubacteria group bacterium]
MQNIITLEDFKKLDIKIGKVVSAEKIPDSDKLIKFIFDVGNQQRQIIAGIAEFFPDTAVLIGKEMPILLNLEPKRFRGNASEGMIIAVDVDGRPVFLHPEEKVPPGSTVR